MTTSDPTPSNHDTLIAELDFLPEFVVGMKGTKMVPLADFTRERIAKALTDAATALRAEQSARQAAEARLTEIFEQWQRSFMGADLLTKEFAERVTPMMHGIRAERRNAPTESKEAAPKPDPENKDSKLKEGDKVPAAHIGGSTAARVGNEIWFSDMGRHKYAVLADYLDEEGRLWWGGRGVSVMLDDGQHVQLTDWLRSL